jgi:hypothetical protein
VDLRYFELHDLLCDALIALEAGDAATAGRRLRKALAWAEADWLATPSALAAAPGTTAPDGGQDAADDE